MESAIAPEAMEEVLEELTGESARKWALVLLAFVVGFAVAVSLIRFQMRRTADTRNEPDADLTTTASGASASEATYVEPVNASGWAGKRAVIARADTAMRERVGRVGDRLQHVGRKR